MSKCPRFHLSARAWYPLLRVRVGRRSVAVGFRPRWRTGRWHPAAQRWMTAYGFGPLYVYTCRFRQGDLPGEPTLLESVPHEIAGFSVTTTRGVVR